MTLQLEDSSPPANDELLDAMEHALGVKLPHSYRAFLKTTNGGYFYGDDEDTSDDTSDGPDDEEPDSIPDTFYPAEDATFSASEIATIAAITVDVLRDQFDVPNRYVAIGFNYVGEIFILDTDSGRVEAFEQHDSFEERELVAESLDELLAKMTGTSDDELAG